jgi:hypothetical protein
MDAGAVPGRSLGTITTRGNLIIMTLDEGV